ncbi:MAG TPA: branched-chain amino acid ABC transporter substrate-binding protein [Gemmatimonadaceae bacterium]|nr:branched-chain amino acid ABC transporter substrate-binding protein [Gemmatimonadaceae bacterium]
MPTFRPHRQLRLCAPVVVLLAAGCGVRDGSAALAAARAGAASDSLYIGVAAARSASGTAYFRGVELAVADLNASRPAGSRPFALRMPPEGQPSQVAVAAAFRDDPTVVGVVGHTGSAQTLDAAPVYGDVEHDGRHAVVAVTPTATNPAVSRASEWVFRICPTDDDAALALARFATDSIGAKRVAVIYRNDLFGRGFTHTIAPLLESGGARVTERDPYLAGVTAYEAYAARIVRGRADAVVIAGGAADAAEMVRAMRHAGGNPAVLGTDDVAGIGADSAAAREFRGVRFTSFYLPDRPVAGASSGFADAYRKRFDETPGHRAALAYDAAMLIGRAAIAAGPERARIRDWLAAVGRGAPAYAGATGEIRFDEFGGAVGKQVIVGEVRP